MFFDVRKAFYRIVCFVTLALSAWGAYTVLSVAMRTFWLTEADQYYSSALDSVDSDDGVLRKNAVRRRQADFAWALPVLIINLPMFLFFYPEGKKKE